MIIAKAPYRISFAGGGTDLPAFYEREPGAVLSTTIDRYVYVSVHPRFERHAQHMGSVPLQNLVDCARSLNGVVEPTEIRITSDFPSGTGMGGSGALCCALMKALQRVRSSETTPSKEFHAHDAWKLEQTSSGHTVGKQDHYASAFGGFNYFRFTSGKDVSMDPVSTPHIALLEAHCFLCYTGQQRDAGPILEAQSKVTPDLMEALRAMKGHALEMKIALEAGDIEFFARTLDTTWLHKRSLGCGISNPDIDAWYETARRNGAWGGKLLGAGGGGFMLLIAPPGRHDAILEALNRPRTVPVKFSTQGAQVVFDDGVRS